MTTIKSDSPRTTKGMTLNGNILSGDTFNVREHIKTNWDGKWDANRKVWIVNPEKVVATITAKTWGMDRILSLSDEQPTQTTQTRNTHTGWCNKCHSYCYGDCQS